MTVIHNTTAGTTTLVDDEGRVLWTSPEPYGVHGAAVTARLLGAELEIR